MVEGKFESLAFSKLIICGYFRMKWLQKAEKPWYEALLRPFYWMIGCINVPSDWSALSEYRWYRFNSLFLPLNVGWMAKNVLAGIGQKAILSKGTKPMESGGGGVNQDRLSIWTQYYFEGGNNTVVDQLQALAEMPPNTGTPLLILTLRSDRTRKSKDLLDMDDHSSMYQVSYARHDVFLSPGRRASEECLGYFKRWLKKTNFTNKGLLQFDIIVPEQMG